MRTNDRSVPLPQEATLAADRGDVIDAIKITRERTGRSLKEAKDAVDVYLHGGATRDAGIVSIEIPSDAIASLCQGKLIDAIKKTRARTGLGLKDAKEAVELHLARNADTNRRFRAATAQQRRGVLRVVGFLMLAGLIILGYLSLAGDLR